MIERLIGSRARTGLLSLFTSNPEKRFYVRELARRTSNNVNSVRRELANLERLGLLRSEAEANLLYYRINQKAPIYAELRGLFLKTEGVAGALRGALAQFDKVECSFIYGSFAKGEERADSDVDLMIIGRADERKLVKAVRAVEEQLSRNIDYTLISPQEFKSRLKDKDAFIANVAREKKIVLAGEMVEAG